MPRWTKGIAVGLGLALLAAACGTDDSSSSSSDSESSEDFAGTIKIGANAELSGFDQAFGQSQVDGIQLAVDDINADGGVEVGGEQYELELVTVDNRSDPTGVVQAANELAADDILASTSPNNSFAAGYEIMKEDGMLVFGGTPELALTILGAGAENPALYSVIPFSPLLFPAWLPQLQALFPDIERIGVLIEDDEVAAPLVGSIEGAAQGLGMEVVAVERFTPGTTDFATQLTRIKEANPDIVFTGRVPIHNVPAMQQAADLDVAPYLWAFTGIPADLGDLDAFDGKTLVFSQFSLTVGEGVTIPALEEGAAKLDETLGDDVILPEITIALYNFTQLLAAGIEKAQTTDDAEAVAKAMEGLRYSGPFGQSRIDPMHFQDHQTGQIVYEDGETTFYIYKSINDVEPSETITID